MAGVQLTEGPLAGEVPASEHLGALSSNARAGGDTNTASTVDTNGVSCALCELLAVKLGTGGDPCWSPAIHACNSSINQGTMAVSVVPSCCCTCSWTIFGSHATCALSS